MGGRPGHMAALAGASLCVVALISGCSNGPIAAAPTAVPAGSTRAPGTPAPATPEITDEPLRPLQLLWERHGERTSTRRQAGTYWPAVDPVTGDVWVSASMEDTIWIFAPDGTPKGSFGEPGDGEGEFEFSRPACRDCPGAGALAFAADGSLYVGDVGNHRIQKFNADHEFERQWGTFGPGQGQFADILGVSTVGTEVFVVDDVRGDVQVFDLDGAYLRVAPFEDVPRPDLAGNLHVIEGQRVIGYRADGTVFQTTALPLRPGEFPIGLALAGDGRIFLNFQSMRTADAVAVAEVDPTTGEARFWSSAGENLAIAGDVLFQSNYISAGWPEAVLRAYRLPEP